ncbi:MAG: phage tail protein [Cyanobacteria bacterium J06639_14]
MSSENRPSLHLSLTPLQLPETSLANEQGGWSRRYGGQQSQSTLAKTEPSLTYGIHPEVVPHLRLCPGEPSQLVAQIRNQSTQAWQFRIGVSADIPPDWCQLLDDDFELPSQGTHNGGPNATTEVEIPFQLPVDFFENHYALKPDNHPLKIDYDGQIQIYARPQGATRTSEHLMATASFRMLVRSPSRYLDYLPQVYGDIDFVGRLLQLFEQTFEPSVETLKLLWAYLDPQTSPLNLLPFLAHWVGWPTDFPWNIAPPSDITRQRQLIHNAMELYRWRGTEQGLRHYLHLYTGLPKTDDCIHIENALRPGFEVDIARLDETAIIEGGRPYHFIVRLRSHPPQIAYADLDAQRPLIHTLIDQEKPAFCTFELHIEEPSQP